MPALTTTSYALLGQLAYRPWTAYELAKGMAWNFDYFWPRARSLVYAEVKRLAGAGLVQGEKSFVGARSRTTYSITPEGKGALRQWLATPPTVFGLEMEALVRVWLAGFGRREDLLQTLARTRAEAEKMLRVAGEVREAYLEGRAPGQAHVHVRALLVDFLSRYAELARDWAIRSEASVARWGDIDRVGKERAALRKIRAAPALPADSSQRSRRARAR